MTEERTGFRYTVGLIAVVGGLAGLIALYWVEIPAGNRDAVTLALGIILGWGSSVINGEWGSSPAGRKAAEVGVEAQRKALDGPTETKIVNTPAEPANVQQVDDAEERA